ncbi:hypothetical protein L1965_13920 [Paracoccus sp. EGI L200073]|nr:hypothetical protein [Paracoccus salsus]
MDADAARIQHLPEAVDDDAKLDQRGRAQPVDQHGDPVAGVGRHLGQDRGQPIVRDAIRARQRFAPDAARPGHTLPPLSPARHPETA